MHNLNIGRKNYIPSLLVLFMLFLAIFVLPKFIIEGVNTPRIYFFILALPLCIIFLISSKVAILTMVLSVFFADWLTQYIQIIPREMSWITEVILGVLLFKAILLCRGKGFQRTPIGVVVLSIIGLGVISALINSVSPVMMLLAFRIYLRFVLLFYIIINLDLDERFLKTIVSLLIIIALIQVPISIYQSFTWTPEVIVQKGLQGRLDYAGGTLARGATGINTIFILFIISLLLGIHIAKNSSVVNWVLVVFLLIQPMVGQGKAVFLYLPLLILFLLFMPAPEIKMKRYRQFIPIILIILISIPVISIFGKWAGWNPLEFVKSLPEYFERDYNAFYPGQWVGRTAKIAYINRQLATNVGYLLFGLGPGVATPTVFSSFIPPLFYELSLFGIPRGMTYTRLITEWGYIGFFLFLFILFQIFKYNFRFLKNVNSRYWKAISFGFSGVIFLYFSSTFYTYSWTADATSFTFWFLAATIFSVGKKKKIL